MRVVWRQSRCWDIILKWSCLKETNWFVSDKKVFSGLHRSMHSVHYQLSYLKTIAMLRHYIEISMLKRDKWIRSDKKVSSSLHCSMHSVHYWCSCVPIKLQLFDDSRDFETLYWNDHTKKRQIDSFLTKRCTLVYIAACVVFTFGGHKVTVIWRQSRCWDNI